MIYTSYYAVMQKIPKTIIPVSISKGIPAWYLGQSYNILAPRWNTVDKYRKGGSWEEYIKEYYDTILNKLDPTRVMNDLKEIGNDVVLLCYEKSRDNCHRHLVAQWLRDNDIQCEEYKFY